MPSTTAWRAKTTTASRQQVTASRRSASAWCFIPTDGSSRSRRCSVPTTARSAPGNSPSSAMANPPARASIPVSCGTTRGTCSATSRMIPSRAKRNRRRSGNGPGSAARDSASTISRSKPPSAVLPSPPSAASWRGGPPSRPWRPGRHWPTTPPGSASSRSSDRLSSSIKTQPCWHGGDGRTAPRAIRPWLSACSRAKSRRWLACTRWSRGLQAAKPSSPWSPSTRTPTSPTARARATMPRSARRRRSATERPSTLCSTAPCRPSIASCWATPPSPSGPTCPPSPKTCSPPS